MKKLIIGIGGCGNNIINLVQDQIDDSYKTISIQKDLQLLAISKADFKLNPKEKDFKEKLNIIFGHSVKIIFIFGTAGSSSILYLENIIQLLRLSKIPFDILAVKPSKFEGENRIENSRIVSKRIRELTRNYTFISNEQIKKSDDEIIDQILDYSITLNKAIEKIEKENLCISDAYAIGSCSTCGCGDADKLVKKIDNIEDELISFDIENMIKDVYRFSSYRDFSIELKVIIFIFYRVRFDKEKVLNYWIENLSDNCIRFFDAILYYVIKEKISSEKVRNNWFIRCESLSEKLNDNSLRESISYTY